MSCMAGFDDISMFLSTPPSRVATGSANSIDCYSTGFYPRHPRGWRRFTGTFESRRKSRFYPRHPRGWRLVLAVVDLAAVVSIHATLAGGDCISLLCGGRSSEFLSTPPSRVATFVFVKHFKFFFVSIHATLAGGDVKGAHCRVVDVDVSIHATLAGGDFFLRRCREG